MIYQLFHLQDKQISRSEIQVAFYAEQTGSSNSVMEAFH
jgi:hypothetical protein